MKNKTQKREIVIKEYDDGSFKVEGSAWDIDLQKDEMQEFLEAWRKDEINEKSPLELGTPKMIQEAE